MPWVNPQAGVGKHGQERARDDLVFCRGQPVPWQPFNGDPVRVQVIMH